MEDAIGVEVAVVVIGARVGTAAGTKVDTFKLVGAIVVLFIVLLLVLLDTVGELMNNGETDGVAVRFMLLNIVGASDDASVVSLLALGMLDGASEAVLAFVETGDTATGTDTGGSLVADALLLFDEFLSPLTTSNSTGITTAAAITASTTHTSTISRRFRLCFCGVRWSMTSGSWSSLWRILFVPSSVAIKCCMGDVMASRSLSMGVDGVRVDRDASSFKGVQAPPWWDADGMVLSCCSALVLRTGEPSFSSTVGSSSFMMNIQICCRWTNSRKREIFQCVCFFFW